MLNNINLNLLRSLLVLLQECHVTRAAKRLNITQSAMSRQLSQLRDLFNDPLLIRDGNDLHKTSKAAELQIKLEELFGEFRYLIEEQLFEPSEWAGEVSFACSDYVAEYIFPEIIKSISALAPKTRFTYHFWQPELLEDFARSPIKLASTLGKQMPAGLSGKLIGEDHLVCVMREHHPLADQRTSCLNDILNWQHVVITGGGDKSSELDEALTELGLCREVGLRVPFYSAAFATLLQTDYLLMIPRHIARNMQSHLAITFQELPLTLPAQKYWLIWHPNYDNDPSHKWMREQSYEILRGSIYSVGYDSKS